MIWPKKTAGRGRLPKELVRSASGLDRVCDHLALFAAEHLDARDFPFADFLSAGEADADLPLLRIFS